MSPLYRIRQARSGYFLRRKYHPEPFDDRELALVLVGAPPHVRPEDVVAYLYPSWRAWKVFARRNRRLHGHPSLGAVARDGGVLGVIDLRPALASVRLGSRRAMRRPAYRRCWTCDWSVRDRRRYAVLGMVLCEVGFLMAYPHTIIGFAGFVIFGVGTAFWSCVTARGGVWPR